MKKIIQLFLDRFIEMLALAIEKKIEKTQVRFIQRKSIDELIRIVENTVFTHGDVTINYNKRNLYSMEVKDNDKIIVFVEHAKTVDSLFEEAILRLIDKGAEMKNI